MPFARALHALCAARVTQFLYRLTSQNRARVGPFLDSCESVCKDEGVVKDRILLSCFVTPPASLHSFCLSCTPRFSIRCCIGSLETGKLADIVVLEKDLYKIPPADISTTKVKLTMMNGKVTYKAQ